MTGDQNLMLVFLAMNDMSSLAFNSLLGSLFRDIDSWEELSLSSLT